MKIWNERRDVYLKKKWKTRLTAGLLAVMLGCSALFSVQTEPVFAASAKQEETQKAEAEDLTIEKGEDFDIASDFTGIHTEEGDKVSYVASADEDGKAFDADRAGSYDCIYRVEKVTGETYEVVRTITVSSEKESTTPSSQQKEKDASSEEEDPDPAGAEIELEGVTEEDALYLSVVPSALALTRESANLVQGERIWYPSDLGHYSTCYFYVNDRLAYCIESNLNSPPSADYVAEIYESNLNLQKVLYYGYGGPGIRRRRGRIPRML